MTTPADRVEPQSTPHFRREAYPALSGRVPVLLAIAIALLSGGLLGYSWRMLTEPPAETVLLRCRAPAPLYRLPWPDDPAKRKASIVFIGEKAPCVGVNTAAPNAAAEAAAPPVEER